MKHFLILLLFAFFLSAKIIAQNITNQNWQTEDDFRLDEDNVKENIIWLEENPLATSSNDTKAVTEYVLNWLSNTPYISVTNDEVFLEGLTNIKKYKFGEKFRVTYLFGKSYYIITNPEKPNEANASARGVLGMVKVYQELKIVDPSVRHRILEKYSRLVKSNRLESYIQTRLNKIAPRNL